MSKKEFFERIKNNNIIIHISKDLNHSGYFYPRVPKNRLVKGKEDSSVNRICCSETICGCLTSLTIHNPGVFKVFLIDVNKYGIRDKVIYSQELYKNKLVEDAYITKECWITTEIQVLEEDSYIVAINELDSEEVEYLIPYDILLESESKNIDSVDLYRKKYGDEPMEFSMCSIFDEESVDIIDREFLVEKLLNSLEYLEDEYMFDEDESESIEEFIDRYDINFLGEGASRKVYSFLDMVVKLPISEDGEIQNSTEWNIFSKEQKSLSILNQSYYIEDCGILFQDRLKPLEDNRNEDIISYINKNRNIFSTNQIELICEEIEFLYKQYDLLKEDIMKLSSWGFVNGFNGIRKEIKLFDYGITNSVYEKYYS